MRGLLCPFVSALMIQLNRHIGDETLRRPPFEQLVETRRLESTQMPAMRRRATAQARVRGLLHRNDLQARWDSGRMVSSSTTRVPTSAHRMRALRQSGFRYRRALNS